MNKIIFLLFLLNSYAYAGFDNGYAIVFDSYGNANLRSEENLNSKNILGMLSNYTPVSCVDSMTENAQFCYIKTAEKEGFVHKSRLLFFKDSHIFQKIALKNKKTDYALFSNKDTMISIKIKHEKFKKSDFLEKIDKNKNKYYIFRGNNFFGTDGQPIYSAYRFSNISLKIGKKEILVPKSEFSQAIIPEYDVSSGELFKDTYIYINPINNHIYMFFSIADGAAIYTIVFEFRKNIFYRKYIWSEAI